MPLILCRLFGLIVSNLHNKLQGGCLFQKEPGGKGERTIQTLAEESVAFGSDLLGSSV